jgi:hypothetical protein
MIYTIFMGLVATSFEADEHDATVGMATNAADE